VTLSEGRIVADRQRASYDVGEADSPGDPMTRREEVSP